LCGCERPLSYYSKYGRNSQPHSFSKVMDRRWTGKSHLSQGLASLVLSWSTPCSANLT
jgi:hypothetical protein